MFKYGFFASLSLAIVGCMPVITQSPSASVASSVEVQASRQQTTPADRYAQGLAALSGDGVPRSLGQAVYWFEQVVDTTHPQWSRMALLELARIYRGEHDATYTNRVKAAQYLERCQAYRDSRCEAQLQELGLYPDVYQYRHMERFVPKYIAFTPLGAQATFSMITDGQTERALPHLEYHARQGNREAQMLMAMHLLDQDNDEAFVEGIAWAYLAAQQQMPEGQYLIGLYLQELEGSESQDESARWLTSASNLGLVEASYDLGMRYLSPTKSKAPHYDQAHYFLSRADEQGSVYAKLHLGDMYYEGLGVIITLDRARAYYVAAAEGGSEEAMERLLTRFDRSVAATSAPPVTSAAQTTETEMPMSGVLAPAELFRQLSATVHVISLFEDQSNELVLVGQGSGIAISPKTMITNSHVVEQGAAIVSTNIPRKEGASGSDLMLWEVVKADKERDLALLRLIDGGNDSPLPHVTRFRMLNELSIGQSVWAIGAPQGLDKTLSSGIISSFRDSAELNRGYSKKVSYIQTTASISPGSSGGGLFDESGNLIGITSFINKNGEGLNFAVTMDDLEAFLHELRREASERPSSQPRNSLSPSPRTHNAVRKKVY